MRCKDVAPRATEYSERALGPVVHFRVQRHLQACANCRTYVQQLELGARALPSLLAAPVGASQPSQVAVQDDAALAVFRAWHKDAPPAQLATKAPVREPYAAVVAVTGAGALLGVALARHPAPLGAAWLFALLLMAAACGAAWFSRSRAFMALVVTVFAAALPALFSASGGLALSVGVQCVLHELFTAALPVTALLVLGRDTKISPSALAGVAAAGALAGDAALHISCPAAESLPHVLVFHVGGVIAIAALVGSAAGRLLQAAGNRRLARR